MLCSLHLINEYSLIISAISLFVSLPEDRLKSLLSEENEEISWFTRELFKGTDIDPESAGTLIKTIAENIVEISRQEYAHYVTDGLSAVSTLDNVANIQALIDSRQFD